MKESKELPTDNVKQVATERAILQEKIEKAEKKENLLALLIVLLLLLLMLLL